MKKTILITGSNGKIGRALTEGLSQDFDIKGYDLPDHDATNYQQLLGQLAGCYGVVHLAFDYQNENSKAGKQGNPENILMGETVLAAVGRLGIRKCIMASSVNAARAINDDNAAYISTKLHLERTAGLYAERFPDTDFTSARFGRVTPDDIPPSPPLRDDQTWLSKRDAAAFARACLASEPTGGHTVAFAVSRRDNPPYDTANPWGWEAQDTFGND